MDIETSAAQETTKAPLILVGMPSADGYVLGRSMVRIGAAVALLGRPMALLFGDRTGISAARNAVLAQARAFTDADEAWILWVDSDMELGEGHERALADYIREAEETGRSWTTNVPMAGGANVLMAADSHHLTHEEILALPDWAPIGWPNMAFSYIRTPLHYTFHEGPLGEDVYFSIETGVKVHFARRIMVRHRKAQYLVGPATWDTPLPEATA